MKKTFKGILALFLALALLCAAVPSVGALYNDHKGEIFSWDVSTTKFIQGNLSTTTSNYDYFGIESSDDVVASIELNFYNNPNIMTVDIYEDTQVLLYTVDYSKSVNLVMEAEKMYTFVINYKDGVSTDTNAAYRIDFTKIRDFYMIEPNNDSCYLWNGRGTQHFDKQFPRGVYDFITRYYATTDTTFNLYFNVSGYLTEDHRNIVVNCPNGEYVVYNGSPLSTTITLEAGEYFYITLRSSSIVPSNFQYYITLTEI